MAYTRIHAIKTTVGKSVDYICNPEKTDERLLISSFGTGPNTAEFDFNSVLSHSPRQNINKAYHLIQSFAPWEVSYDEAHQIGCELAERLLEGKYKYVLATHIDHDHVHNHIIFCASDNIEFKKYHSCKSSYKYIRSLSDELCEEHHLSVIYADQNKGKQYKEWLSDNDGISWKTQLKKDIRDAIKISPDYESFVAIIKAKGYEIKGESLEPDSPKYIAFKAPDSAHFIRGCARSLGNGYSKEEINNRILRKSQLKSAPDSLRIDSFIDVNQDKYKDNPGLRNWAELQNLKLAAKVYSETGTTPELISSLEKNKTILSEARATYVTLQKKQKILGELISYVQNYESCKNINIEFQKSKNPDAYFRAHETELRLYDGAVNFITSSGLNINNISCKMLKEKYRGINAEIESIKRTIDDTKRQVDISEKQVKELNKYFIQTSSITSIYTANEL